MVYHEIVTEHERVMAVSEDQECPLLSLPPELRLRIYEFLYNEPLSSTILVGTAGDLYKGFARRMLGESAPDLSPITQPISSSQRVLPL